jgi:hypothetical protein
MTKREIWYQAIDSICDGYRIVGSGILDIWWNDQRVGAYSAAKKIIEQLGGRIADVGYHRDETNKRYFAVYEPNLDADFVRLKRHKKLSYGKYAYAVEVEKRTVGGLLHVYIRRAANEKTSRETYLIADAPTWARRAAGL